MAIFIYDVDGTLTPPRHKMTDSFAETFRLCMKKTPYVLVSGSNFEKIKEQVPEDILREAEKIFACNGNDVWVFNDLDDVWRNIRTHEFKDNEALIAYLKWELEFANCPFPKFKTHFEFRPGLLNFSIIGREASFDERNAYETWDNQDGERRRIVNGINSRFGDAYEASIGGQISIDVVERGHNKSMILKDLSGLLIFYGDKIAYGNDKPLADAIRDRQLGFAYEVTGPDDLQLRLLEDYHEVNIFRPEQ